MGFAAVFQVRKLYGILEKRATDANSKITIQNLMLCKHVNQAMIETIAAEKKILMTQYLG